MRLVVHVLCEDTHLELKALIGQPALVELLCQDSRSELRPWHGHIVAAALIGSDGGLARYRLVIEPWLAVLQHRIDSYVFQDLSVPQIIDEVFADHAGQGKLAPAWRWDLADADVYPRRSVCVQYQESDLDFVERLMLEEGLFCWWEHQGAADDDTLGSHTLVISDHNGAFTENRQPVVRFTQSDHSLGEDSLTQWRGVQQVASARVDLSSRDHRSRDARPVQADVAGARLAELGIHDTPGAYAYESLAQGERLAGRQAQALGALRERKLGSGPWRRAAAGSFFTLADHPGHSGLDPQADSFVILTVQHRARNNFSADQQARLQALGARLADEANEAASLDATDGDAGSGAGSRAPYPDDDRPLHEAVLLVQPLATPVRLAAAEPVPPVGAEGSFGRLGERGLQVQEDAAIPGPDLFDPGAHRGLASPDVRLHRKPTVHGTQTALVVGNGPVHTDRDARIKVQLHWQRGGASSHRLMHPAGDNAPASEASFTWVRVGQAQAGMNHGAVFIPRVGQEVVVAFAGGDIDRPLIVGSAYNGEGTPDAQGNQVGAGAAGATGNAPAWFPGQAAAGERQGHQHPAVLLGHKSQELGSSTSGFGGYTQLVFDDSPGANRIELGASTVSSRLQLGNLIHQDDNQRLAPRGHGLDLATGGHGALRAGSGLLISAHAEAPSTAGGLQLQARGPQLQLQTAQDLTHALAETAQAHQTQLKDEPAVQGAKPDDAAKQLPTEQGLQSLVVSLRACQAAADPGSTVFDGGRGTVPAWSRPDMVLAAPAGIGLFTPAYLILSAGTNLSFVAGQDIGLLAQGNACTVAKLGILMYTQGQATNPNKPNQETGIAIHAATGSLHASANSSTANLAASQAVEVVSSTANVLVSAPIHVLLTAAGAALDIQPSSITLKGPGKIEFKAGMKNWTSAGSTSQSVALTSTDLKDCPWLKS